MSGFEKGQRVFVPRMGKWGTISKVSTSPSGSRYGVKIDRSPDDAKERKVRGEDRGPDLWATCDDVCESHDVGGGRIEVDGIIFGS